MWSHESGAGSVGAARSCQLSWCRGHTVSPTSHHQFLFAQQMSDHKTHLLPHDIAWTQERASRRGDREHNIPSPHNLCSHPSPSSRQGRVLGGDLASAAMWVSRAGRLLSHPYLRVAAGLVLAAGRGEAVAGVRGDVDGGAQAPAAGQGAGHPVVGALVGALVTPVTPGHLGPGPLVAPPVLPLAAGGTPTRAVASADGHGAALGVTADK